jgi:hypothetical protein
MGAISSRRTCGRPWKWYSSSRHNNIAPGLADHYLARTGYAAQQYDGAADSDQPNNLWRPLPGDYGAHGDFDARARPWSLQFWATTHRGTVALAGLGIAGAMYALCRRNGR